MKKLILLCSTLLLCLISFSQTVKYVTTTGAGLNDGSSWINALPGYNLRSNIFTSSADTQYWLKAGNYQAATINLLSGISIYGGFSGNETVLNQRNPAVNITTFIASENGFYIGNPTSPVVLDGVTVTGGYASTVNTLGGFGAGVHIIDGWDNVTINNVIFTNNSALNGGGAIYIKGTNASSPTITNCTFNNNNATIGSGGYGAAIYLDAISLGASNEIHPIITNCKFNSNTANGKGGAISVQAEDGIHCFVRIDKCSFIANRSYYGGGAISCLSRGGNATCAITNSYYKSNICAFGGAIETLALTSTAVAQAYVERSVFESNTANYGGAISNGYNTSSVASNQLGNHSSFIANCDFVNNSAANGSAIYNQGAFNTQISNSIVYNSGNGTNQIVNLDYNNATLANINNGYNDFYPNPYIGTANINSDPLFYNQNNALGSDGIIGTADDGFQLSCASPAINAGNNNFGLGIDITNNLVVGNPDIGAYEQSGNPLVPSVSIVSTSTTVCLGTDVTFTATATNFSSNPYYYWKKNGVDVGAGSTYTDNTLLNNDVIMCVVKNNNASFICQTTNTATSNSITITGTTPAVPAAVTPQIFCYGATINDLTATGTGVKWYNTATGGSPLTSNTVLSGGQVYYANQTISGCESTRIPITATVNFTPLATSYSQVFCNSATVADLIATGTAIKWYASATGGGILDSSTPLNTGTYYVTQTLNNCESYQRKAVSVTVNSTPIATTFPQTLCSTATVANLEGTGTSLQWYAAPNGGNPIASTNPIVEGTYYVTQTLNSCESATRTSVAITVINSPLATASDQIFCNTATVANLVATGTALQWYAFATGGTALTSTNSITNGAAYYVTQTLNGCESPSRAVVNVTINATTSPMSLPQTFCGSKTVADLIATGTALKWYTAATGGTALATTTALTTGTYYASQTLNSCESTRTAVSITVNSLTTPVFTQVAAICSGASLLALPTTSTNAITGTWSPAVNNTSTTTYTFTATAGQCATRQTMTITVNPNVTPTFMQVASICSGSSLSALPTTSTNSVTGNWSPALNNTATTTYTFTPTAGQCATTKTITITVVPQPAQPTLACYQSATFNTSSCSWDVTGTQPTQPTLVCYQSATFNISSCSWDVIGTQPTQPTLACYQSATFNMTTCAWDVAGTAPAVPTGNAIQTFTVADLTDATIANLVVNQTNVIWYASLADAQAAINSLQSTIALINGATYYAVNNLNGCASNPFAVQVTVTLGNPRYTVSTLQIYPVPVKTILFIQSSNNETIDKITITDLTGKVVLIQTSNTMHVNVEKLASGVYVIKGFSGKEQFISKFIKE